MARKRKPAPAPRLEKKTTDYQRLLWPAGLVLAVLICYWTPLTSSDTSILWDAADHYQVAQKYFCDELRAGRLPLWNPYIFSGYPFLADLQAGAWYPPNWPFFVLFGASPRAVMFETILHGLLACLGAYLLSRRLLGDRAAAVLAGLCYGLSGFFVGHSSHTPLIQGAACWPWVLLFFLRALEARTLFNSALAVLAAACMILAGHFQTTLYGFLALGLFALSRWILEPQHWRRILALAMVIPCGATVLSAVQTLPTLELLVHSSRSSLSAVAHTEGMIPPRSLLGLLYANNYGIMSGDYRGPGDITQYCFYAGLLLVPLALLGLRNRTIRWTAALLIVPTLWYAAGHAAGLYLVVARLPGFSSIRSPVHIWFVVAMGLALLAGAGLVWLRQRWPVKWLPALLVVVVFLDVWYWNFQKNPVAYGRASWAELYGKGEELFQRVVAPAQPPLTRFDAPPRLTVFGPMNHPMDARVETTYGYNPLTVSAYDDYLTAMEANPKLRNGLNVSRYLDTQRGAVAANPDVLPRAYFPKSLTPVASPAESRRRLSTLDPAQTALVPAKLAGLSQDSAAQAQILDYSGSRYRIHYRARSDSLLRVSVTWFPGWKARVDGRDLEVLRVDHALMGVLVPAGEKDLQLEYHSTYFSLGAAISLIGVALCGMLLKIRPSVGDKSDTPAKRVA